MNIEQTLSIISSLRDGWYNSPTTYVQKKSIFMYQSYRNSAINEIISHLRKHKKDNPITVIENFRHEMDCYACKTKNGDVNFMFSVYYDVATDVLDILISYGVKE